MALTYPAAFVFVNAATAASITASSSLTLAPPSKLQTDHVGEKWRTETDTAYLTIALAANTTIDSIGLFGLSLTTAGITRVRCSLSDVSAQDGAVYDSGSVAGRVSAYYGNLVALMPASASVRYIRIDISEPGAAFVEAGFLMIGLKNQVTINFAFGASDAPIDPSVVTLAPFSGAEWIDQRQSYREWDFNFDFLNETERFGWVEDLDRLIGASKNIMMVRKCDSTNLGRDTLCGRVSNAPPTLNREGFISGGLAYSKAYKIKQRL